MNVRIFTFFNSGYLNQGIALIHSILAHESEVSEIIIYPLDKITRDELIRWFKLNGKVKIRVPIAEIKRVTGGNHEITNRHHFYLLKPLLFAKTLEENSESGWVFYFDADLYVFRACLTEVISKHKFASVILSEHLFSRRTRNHQIYGKINAGLIGANAQIEPGRQFIFDWANECLRTFSSYENHVNFSDQLVLEVCAHQFENSAVLSSLGINQSTWVLDNFFVPRSLQRIKKLVQELKIFHFHGLKDSLYLTKLGLDRYGHLSAGTDILFNKVYAPYIQLQSEIRVHRNLPSNLEVKMSRVCGRGYPKEIVWV